MTSLLLSQIAEGERDRSDLGDIAGLAKSISEIGLLHPPVVTAANELVAGGRRLAAVRSLGWTEVPVTVVDYSTAAQALQAEAEENTCRKSLTPYEASLARERRARVLAPKAAERRGDAIKDRDERGRAVPTPAKLAGVGAAPPASAASRETRKAAAITTGYSGSTLDKVDRIRDAAERGIVRVPRVIDGKEKRVEVPAPAPVIEVAKKALADVKKTGAAIDRSERDFRAAVEAYVDSDADVRRARYAKTFMKALNGFGDITNFDPADVAENIDADTWETALDTHRTVNSWFTRAREARRGGLRLVGGVK